MTPHFAALKEFHEKFGLGVHTVPRKPPEQVKELRINLIKEEFQEFEEASHNYDIIEVADAIADLLYVVYGAALEWGINADVVFQEVHRSNMTKIWPDGTIHRREEDGKILKPPTYSPADVKGVLSL